MSATAKAIEFRVGLGSCGVANGARPVHEAVREAVDEAGHGVVDMGRLGFPGFGEGDTLPLRDPPLADEDRLARGKILEVRLGQSSPLSTGLLRGQQRIEAALQHDDGMRRSP